MIKTPPIMVVLSYCSKGFRGLAVSWIVIWRKRTNPRPACSGCVLPPAAWHPGVLSPVFSVAPGSRPGHSFCAGQSPDDTERSDLRDLSQEPVCTPGRRAHSLLNQDSIWRG